MSNQILLGAAPFRNPPGGRNPQGDCGPCASKVIIDHFYPDRPISFEDTALLWQNPKHGGGTIESPTWGCAVRHLANNAATLGYDIDTEVLFWPPTSDRWDLENFDHNWYWHEPVQSCYRDIHARLEAGWLILAGINQAYRGLTNPDGTVNAMDHWVVIDGADKREWTRPATNVTLETELFHVVCSTGRGRYWVEVQHMLRMGGLGAVLAIRPKKEATP